MVGTIRRAAAWVAAAGAGAALSMGIEHYVEAEHRERAQLQLARITHCLGKTASGIGGDISGKLDAVTEECLEHISLMGTPQPPGKSIKPNVFSQNDPISKVIDYRAAASIDAQQPDDGYSVTLGAWVCGGIILSGLGATVYEIRKGGQS